MSLVRRLGKSFFFALFTTSIIGTMMVFSLASFTEHDNVKNVIVGIVSQSIPISDGETGAQEKETLLGYMKMECQGKELLNDAFGRPGLTIKCSDVKQLDAGGDVKTFIASMMADSIYYKSYECDFIYCVSSGGDVGSLLISKYANDFYKWALNYAILATIIIGAIFVAFCENLNDRLKSLGFALLWSSVPFVATSFFTDQIVGSFVDSELAKIVQPVIDSLFSPAFLIYVYMLIAGIVLVVAGYLVKPENFRFGKKGDQDQPI